MHRIDQATAVSTLPTPAAAGTPGYFTGGNPATGNPATVLDADWANNIQEELISILTAAGITPSKTANNQVLTSIKTIVASSVVGLSRNLFALVTSSTATSVTFSADEIVVESSLGGSTTKLANYNQTLNISTTGAGGMDTGAAPAPGFIAVYAIYNPTTNTQSILATNATSAAASSVYGGTHMPSGYTASALISVVATASGYISPFAQNDRLIGIPNVNVLTSSANTSGTVLSISAAVPFNAKTVNGYMEAGSSASPSSVYLGISSNSSAICQQQTQLSNGTATGPGTIFGAFNNVILTTAQSIYYFASASSGTASFSINISSYTI